jgi:hypothetical protein
MSEHELTPEKVEALKQFADKSLGQMETVFQDHGHSIHSDEWVKQMNTLLALVAFWDAHPVISDDASITIPRQLFEELALAAIAAIRDGAPKPETL